MNNENLNATLRCVTRPSAAQEEKNWIIEIK